MTWNVREEQSFSLCVQQLGGAPKVDRALETILDALRLNPLGFPPAGHKDIRIARTKFVFSTGGIVPALAVRFRVNVAERIVSLLHAELAEPDEMDFGGEEWPWK